MLDFAHALTIPSVATFHTLPRQPTENQREIIAELVRTVQASIVMSETAAQLLATTYGADPPAIEVIPYGAPDLPSVAPSRSRRRSGSKGSTRS